MSKICIVVPIYKKKEFLTSDELISWQQCITVLATHTICLVCPKGLDISGYYADLTHHQTRHIVEWFKSTSFSSVDTYNHLLLSRSFYQRFIAYDYILTYQLDAFIFKDDLLDWCAFNYSYIGAPWFENFEALDTSAKLWKVGNGGFALRKVSNCLRVLNSLAIIWPWANLTRWYYRYGRKQGLQKTPTLLMSLLFGNNTYWAFNDFFKLRVQFQEDYFWGVVCADKFDWYKVPVPEHALKFSFEVAPRLMYSLNNNELPTGCHAWDEYDPEFWKPFIITSIVS